MAQTALTKSASAEASRSPPSFAGTKRKRVTDQKYYAVQSGRRPGVYHTWTDCLDQVRGHKGALFKAFHTRREAQAYADGNVIPQIPSKTTGEQKYYAVQNGKVPGVYLDWPSAQAQIVGVKGPRHKKFNTRAEAEAFVAAAQNETLTHPDHSSSQITSLVQKSARGMVLKSNWEPLDATGSPYALGSGPPPPGIEDGFDPNIKLGPDGTIVHKTEEEKSKTKFVKKERDPPGMLKIYTDGSSLNNGHAGARAGVGVFFGPGDPKNVSEALLGSRQTNQRAELTAILRALEIAPRHRDVTIYTDSRYSIDCVTNWYKNWEKNGWVNSKGKNVENKDIISEVRARMTERLELGRETRFVWVKGHAGDDGNREADRLAVEGAHRGRGSGIRSDPIIESNGFDIESDAADDDMGMERYEMATGYSSSGSAADEREVEESIRAMQQALEEEEDKD